MYEPNLKNYHPVAPGPAPCADLPVSVTCGVCTHIYIYVVCEPRHGEFPTSAAAQHTQLVTQYT
jgi:hypothetical protein